MTPFFFREAPEAVNGTKDKSGIMNRFLSLCNKFGAGASRSRSRSEPGVFGSLEQEPELLAKIVRSRQKISRLLIPAGR